MPNTHAKLHAHPTRPDPALAIPVLDRDQAILAFNQRVLDWAHRSDVPLLERLRYLCIVSSNLDEFFEVRADAHLSAARIRDHKGLYTAQSFAALSQSTHALVEQQYHLYNAAVLPALKRQGIEIVSHSERDAEQRRWVKDYFEREVRPLLIPIGLDPSHPFPQVANKSLNFIVRLTGLDAFGRENDISIVKVPRVLPRLMRLPERISGSRILFVSLSSVIRAHLQDMFTGREVGQFSQFRVTRHSDLAVDEDDVQNLRTALRQELEQRHYGQAVRLEVASGCSEHLASYLLKQFDLTELSLYRVQGPVNMARLTQLIDLVDEPRLRLRRIANAGFRLPCEQGLRSAQRCHRQPGGASGAGVVPGVGIGTWRCRVDCGRRAKMVASKAARAGGACPGKGRGRSSGWTPTQALGRT